MSSKFKYRIFFILFLHLFKWDSKTYGHLSYISLHVQPKYGKIQDKKNFAFGTFSNGGNFWKQFVLVRDSSAGMGTKFVTFLCVCVCVYCARHCGKHDIFPFSLPSFLNGLQRKVDGNRYILVFSLFLLIYWPKNPISLSEYYAQQYFFQLTLSAWCALKSFVTSAYIWTDTCSM